MEESLEKIFDNQRIQTYLHLILLIFYFPFGLALVTVRFFIGFHAFVINLIFCKFPTLRCIIMRFMCTVLGFVVITQRSENYKGAKVIVANHITNFDHLAVNLVKPCIVPSVWNLPLTLNWVLGYTDFGATKGRQILIENVKHFVQGTDLPVLVFPEGATTNGKVGLLKFSSWPFSLNQPVQPLLIKILRPPFIKVSLSVLGSRWWTDMFWFLFVPYTVFVLRYCPPMEHNAGEKVEEFCSRVQRRICDELSLQPTKFTCTDKVEYAKQFLRVASHTE